MRSISAHIIQHLRLSFSSLNTINSNMIIYGLKTGKKITAWKRWPAIINKKESDQSNSFFMAFLNVHIHKLQLATIVFLVYAFGPLISWALISSSSLPSLILWSCSYSFIVGQLAPLLLRPSTSPSSRRHTYAPIVMRGTERSREVMGVNIPCPVPKMQFGSNWAFRLTNWSHFDPKWRAHSVVELWWGRYCLISIPALWQKRKISWFCWFRYSRLRVGSSESGRADLRNATK